MLILNSLALEILILLKLKALHTVDRKLFNPVMFYISSAVLV